MGPNSFRGAVVALVWIVFALIGCATSTEVVDRRMILPLAADKYSVDEDQHFLMAIPIRTPMPKFPREVTSRGGGPRKICVEFVVTAEGIVEQIEFIDKNLPDCQTTKLEDSTFRAAVTEALTQWSFIGAAICTFPEGVEKEDDCESEGVEVRAVPIRLMYVFTFDTKNGRASISND